jgi:hypothetical protein
MVTRLNIKQLFCAPSRSSFETGFSKAPAPAAADDESAKRGIKNYDAEKSFSSPI